MRNICINVYSKNKSQGLRFKDNNQVFAGCTKFGVFLFNEKYVCFVSSRLGIDIFCTYDFKFDSC